MGETLPRRGTWVLHGLGGLSQEAFEVFVVERDDLVIAELGDLGAGFPPGSDVESFWAGDEPEVGLVLGRGLSHLQVNPQRQGCLLGGEDHLPFFSSPEAQVDKASFCVESLLDLPDLRFILGGLGLDE